MNSRIKRIRWPGDCHTPKWLIRGLIWNQNGKLGEPDQAIADFDLAIEIDPSQLQLGADYRLVDQVHNPVTDYPYLVFSIESTNRRDDWYQIPC
jgi:hypothetical protein